MKRRRSGAIIPAINTTKKHSGFRFGWWFLAAGLAVPGALSGASFNVPPPASLSVTSAPTGARVTYRGATNFQYLVQASTNWLNWSLLASNIATNQAITFTDTQARRCPPVSTRPPRSRRPSFTRVLFAMGRAAVFSCLRGQTTRQLSSGSTPRETAWNIPASSPLMESGRVAGLLSRAHPDVCSSRQPIPCWEISPTPYRNLAPSPAHKRETSGYLTATPACTVAPFWHPLPVTPK